MTQPVLNSHDAGSVCWQKIKSHLNERLAELREENDGDLDERWTAKKRGRIAECRYILSLADPPPKVSERAPMVIDEEEFMKP